MQLTWTFLLRFAVAAALKSRHFYLTSPVFTPAQIQRRAPKLAIDLGSRGRQRAILAYEISGFLFDFPVISLKMTSYVVKVGGAGGLG